MKKEHAAYIAGDENIIFGAVVSMLSFKKVNPNIDFIYIHIQIK